MLSRPASDTTANEDYSMLVMSELKGTGQNGLVNPYDNTSTTPYIVVKDDGTGDLSRSRKDSFYWYKKVCESNGEDLD